MHLGKLRISWGESAEERRKKRLAETCARLGDGCNGNIGETTKAVQDLILEYYADVHEQATASFRSAQILAFFGFLLLVGTVGYVIRLDWMRHLPPPGFIDSSKDGMTVGAIGVISGVIVEFLAGTQLFMHGRTARQFGSFHICLERTHRYLLAYRMAQETGEKAPQALEKIVCIMANAPMITRQDIEGGDPDWISGLLQRLGGRQSEPNETTSPTLVTTTGPHGNSAMLITPSVAPKTSPNGE